GTVSFDENVEHAYWWTEILDAYCRILMLAKGLGRISYFTEPEAGALLDLKEKWGFQDPRAGMKDCDICANDVFRESWKETGVEPQAFQPPIFGDAKSPGPGSTSNGSAPASARGTPAVPNQEALIRAITDRVMAALANR
ncbi:MAG: class II aldolase/adducin family protein, partial [Planctomycetota bacterium]